VAKNLSTEGIIRPGKLGSGEMADTHIRGCVNDTCCFGMVTINHQKQARTLQFLRNVWAKHWPRNKR
jgi:hypothetical protein